MEKKRNRVTQNTAVTAHFEGRRVDCQRVTNVSEKSILTGPFHSEDRIITLLRNVRRHSVNTPQDLNLHQHRCDTPRIGDVLQASWLRSTPTNNNIEFESRVFCRWLHGQVWLHTHTHNKVPYHYVWTTTVRRPTAQKRQCQNASWKPVTTHRKERSPIKRSL